MLTIRLIYVCSASVGTCTLEDRIMADSDRLAGSPDCLGGLREGATGARYRPTSSDRGGDARDWSNGIALQPMAVQRLSMYAKGSDTNSTTSSGNRTRRENPEVIVLLHGTPRPLTGSRKLTPRPTTQK